ncbi:arrestin domain-containing protein 4-like [Trichoplusia ni]|uniref:Arrestin domain-containing protein 4-like n=1 Tax=Trichoplusia ni TaxID=7111 RepID=A0A7E5VWN7_TRINI|nr:arrestin domain-containing protein 4-like [Trichoplusia ni]
MGVKCQLLLNNEGFSLYKAGGIVAGTVNYLVDKPIEFWCATVSLIGTGYCRWEEGSGKTTTIYIGKENYVEQHIDILQLKNHEIVKIQPGSYQFPFQFLLPEDLPSSHVDETGNITYKIKVIFKKAGFIKSSEKFSTTIQVYNDAKPCLPEPLTAGLKKEFLFSSKNKFVFIKGEIDRTFVNAGENLMLTVTVNKKTNIPITGIRTELVNLMTYTSNCKQTTKEHITVNGTVREYPGITDKSETTFRYIIPSFPNLFSIQKSNVIAKEYKARVTVAFPFPHINASLDLPLVLNMVNLEVKKNEIGEGKSTLTQSSSADQPPSYWQVMNEENNKSDDEVEEYVGEKKQNYFEAHSSKS